MGYRWFSNVFILMLTSVSLVVAETGMVRIRVE
jgi:hypothetical protein